MSKRVERIVKGLRDRALDSVSRPARAVVAALRSLGARSRKHLPRWAGGYYAPDEVTFRVLTPAGVDDYFTVMAEEAKSPEGRARVADSIRDATRFCMCGYWRGEPVAVGWCAPQWSALGDTRHWFCGDRVIPARRGRGIGQMLHRARLAEAGRRGWLPVYACVRADNARSVGAFRAVGFERAGEEALAAAIQASLLARGGPAATQLVFAYTRGG